MFAIIDEFWLFRRKNGEWWITLLFLALLSLGMLMVFAGRSALAPFIYTIF